MEEINTWYYWKRKYDNQIKLKTELQELNNSSKEYLDEFVKNNDNNINSIKEYDNAVNSNIDLYQARIYDLAQYNITKELLNKIKTN